MEKQENYSNLTMHRYWISKIDYKFDRSLLSNDKKGLNLSPSFNRNITKVNESKAIVSIEFKVGSDNSPLTIDIVINGLFELDKWEDNKDKSFLMKENTCAILFPYLRQAITSVTVTANIPPLVLPVYNTFNLFNNEK